MYSKQSQFGSGPQRHPTRARSVPIPPRGRNATPRSWRSIAHKLVVIGHEFGVESRIEDEDYLQGLAALRKSW
jgi:hypothetical protein